MRGIPRVLVLAGVAVLAAACAPASQPIDQTSGSPAADCVPAAMSTLTLGTLTFGTGDPAYPPWFTRNTPGNGQGYEGAVADALATTLGYPKDQVAWVRVASDSAIAPGPKKFDLGIDEVPITEDRGKAVGFSSPYYDVTQAVVALKGSTIAGARSLADLKSAKLGARAGTAAYRAITEVIRPVPQAQAYTTDDDAKNALRNGQIDGLVLDLPTAFRVTSAEIDNSLVVGQVPQPTGTPEQFGLVLEKGSNLTFCVSQAVDALRTDGTLDKLRKQWLAGPDGAAELR